jgi:copper chaperone CopZ
MGSAMLLVWFCFLFRAFAFEPKGRAILGFPKASRFPARLPTSFKVTKKSSHDSLRINRGGEGHSNNDALSYYLLSSPRMFSKTLLSMAVLFSTRLAFRSYFDSVGPISISTGASSSHMMAIVFNSVVLPLLSSACCGIQLIINSMVGAGGCAGFNKLLGPLRPYFLAVLLFATSMSIPMKRNMVALTAFKLLLAFLPELLHAYNNRQTKPTKAQLQNWPVHADVEMAVPTMGCVACINKINNSIQNRGLGRILDSESWLNESEKGGRSRVLFVASSEDDAAEIAGVLVDAVVEAGFDHSTIESLKLTRKQ